ncbi:MAG: nucleotidyl transferase AbiEii/AbiGii toxin family protein [Gammaproteobacteria bacterium]|nr:nucleotidyl transferase AbiEii/AbiGii toxin family protein [Gammaproteobacteria bacterium]MYA67713.1 nucleotidyl transferase AbiEii/AbiGii toxin family protein [Gammaproteobacteria bacterium]MYC59371.1 nucleotidyl transferase AbiEii/AbiGii toxin family protein [Gammaproteobacteria bacterium]MYH45598.1 nucleotidyl transferase AbiEii/AbiGii toxin family protein [Gammaproteobacteria bacterium]MYL13100.1 nucleotidyl transferase AbiEii/AbiGii toxin family protein [Gammaproteobacteria bacterium]
MITKSLLTRKAAEENLPAKTIERDYALAHLIAGIAALGNESGLVFKGGTAIRLCFLPEYRYSADLDFSVISGTKEEAYSSILKAFASVSGDISGLRLTDEMPPRISYFGPLGRERFLKLDVSVDELVLNTEVRTLLPHWPDLPANSRLRVYTLIEIAGEKLRCLMQRTQCRDFFDLWVLFTREKVDVWEAIEVFRKKAAHRGIDFREFARRYEAVTERYRKNWDAELGEHVQKSVPSFKQVARGVSRELRRADIL